MLKFTQLLKQRGHVQALQMDDRPFVYPPDLETEIYASALLKNKQGVAKLLPPYKPATRRAD